MEQLEDVLRALSRLRAPLQQGEYDLHRLVMQALEAGGIACEHEVTIAPRCRIDLMCGTVGIEIKRGRHERKKLMAQLQRYAASEKVAALVVVTEKTVALPANLCGKPVRGVCLNRLWGIAL